MTCACPRLARYGLRCRACVRREEAPPPARGSAAHRQPGSPRAWRAQAVDRARLDSGQEAVNRA